MNFLDALKQTNRSKVAKPAQPKDGRWDGIGLYVDAGIVLVYDRYHLGPNLQLTPRLPKKIPDTDVLFGEWVVVNKADA